MMGFPDILNGRSGKCRFRILTYNRYGILLWMPVPSYPLERLRVKSQKNGAQERVPEPYFSTLVSRMAKREMSNGRSARMTYKM